ncbi:hypothetical protein HK101_004963, partial [Irineochytrium annulatum]
PPRRQSVQDSSLPRPATSPVPLLGSADLRAEVEEEGDEMDETPVVYGSLKREARVGGAMEAVVIENEDETRVLSMPVLRTEE